MSLLDAALSVLASRKGALTASELAVAAAAAKQLAKVSAAQERALVRGLDKLAEAGEGVEKVGDSYKAKKAAATAKAKPARKAPATGGTRGGKKTIEAGGEPASGSRRRRPTAGSEEAPAPAASPETPAAPALTDEERELASVYGDELSEPAPALREYRDAQTRDEDRQLLPEINAREERQRQWEGRRSERRERRERERAERRERRQRRDRGGAPNAAALAAGAAAAPPATSSATASATASATGSASGSASATGSASAPRPQIPGAGAQGAAPAARNAIGSKVTDDAVAVFVQLRNSQPVPVKQLAGMMRKRGMLDADPDQVWPHLKATLLSDERRFRAAGLRPRIAYRGRDLFAPGPGLTAPTSTAEAGLATALADLAEATASHLGDRLAGAPHAGFERIAHAYLAASGYEGIEWVKRVDGISYAVATPLSLASQQSRPILVSAHSGSRPVERRGVGELRVGVEAKDLAWGLLLAPGELSDDAQRELERPGRSIVCLVGRALVKALAGSGIGVVTTAAPVRYLDEAFLDDVLAGG